MRWKSAVKRLIGWTGNDYREQLYLDLRDYLGGQRPKRILEIGPKDGADTRRLLQLQPDELTLVDLPRMRETNEKWLSGMDRSRLRYLSANFMYSPDVVALEPFDVVWCTGVLYHNPEQLRMVKRLYDHLIPGGVLVLESSTTRIRALRNRACIEVVYPPNAAYKRKYHISDNVTHLPSAKAIRAWLEMLGFTDLVVSRCHRKQSVALARARAAFIARRPLKERAGHYYTLGGETGFVIGKAL